MLQRNTDNVGNVVKVIDDCNFCTKKCYIAYQKYEDVSNLGWNKDGKNGKDDPNHFEQIIVNWLCKWGNYEKYRQGGGNGVSSKTKICEDTLVPLLKSHGVRVDRTTEQIASKIKWPEAKFCDAMHWGENTAEGVKEDEGNARFEELVKQHCPYYFELLSVFQERAEMKPKMTSDDLSNDLTEESLDAFDENVSISPGESFKNANAADNSGKTMTVSAKSLSDTPQDKSNNNSRSKKRQSVSSAKSSTSPLNQLIALKVEQLKKQEEILVSEDIRKKVGLAKQFKDMVDSFDGDRVHAAMIVPKFK